MADPPPLRVLACWDHDQATIAVGGELDLATAPEALRCLAETLGKNPRRLVLDLAGLTFMDTQGVKLIARARQGLPAGHEVIVRANPSIHRVLTITGMHHVCMIEGGQRSSASGDMADPSAP